MGERDRWAEIREGWERQAHELRVAIDATRGNAGFWRAAPHLQGGGFRYWYLQLLLYQEYLGWWDELIATADEAAGVIDQCGRGGLDPETAAEIDRRRRLAVDRRMSPPPALALPPNILIGTSSFTAPSWTGPFYPQSLPDSERLTYSATRFRTVEIDATWYGPPRPNTVLNWRDRTPDDFVFAAKVPKSITHEKCLVDCALDLELFVETMQLLGPKLGPLLLQFPQFSPRVFPSLDAFLERLDPFLDLLPAALQWAVEVRNRRWLAPPLYEVLRRHRVALAWIDFPRMPLAQYYAQVQEATTADFIYLRLLGDREVIERQTKTWDRVIVDRSRPLAAWADTLTGSLGSVARVHVYANNHYAGCGYQSANQLAITLRPG